jgi:hypothetical protein
MEKAEGTVLNGRDAFGGYITSPPKNDKPPTYAELGIKYNYILRASYPLKVPILTGEGCREGCRQSPKPRGKPVNNKPV